MPSLMKRSARGCRPHLSAMISLILILVTGLTTPLASHASSDDNLYPPVEQRQLRESLGLDAPRPVIVAAQDEESASNQDNQRTLLEVDAVDRQGRPRPDTCFAILDRDGQLRVEACDADDGASDGVTLLRVRDGLEAGTYTLRETFTPAGGAAAGDQNLELGPGRFQVSAQGAGAPPDEETSPPATEPPPTEIPPTEIPPTEVPPTEVPPTEVPATEIPPTEPPPTEIPPTEIPPTETPPPVVATATAVPTIEAPPTQAPTATQPAGEAPPPVPTATPPTEVVETPIVSPTVEPTPVAPVPVEEPGGSVDVHLTGPSGEPVAACVDLFSQVEDYVGCDNDVQDLDPRPGRVRFDPVTPGTYTVEVFGLPGDLAEPEPRQIEVFAGQETLVDFALLSAARTGSLSVTVTDVNGAPVEACVDLVSPSAAYIVCDGDVDDRDARPGHMRLEPVTEGVYSLAIFGLPEPFVAPPEQTVQVRSNEVIEIGLTVASLPGALVIQVENERGEPLGGSCFAIAGNEALANVCDLENEGRVGITLPAGVYTVSQTSSAPGYLHGPERDVRLESGRTIEIVVQNAPQPVPETATPEAPPAPSPTSTPEPTETVPEETGDVAFVTLGDNGDPLPGQCYSLSNSAGTLGPFCDDDERDIEARSGVLLVRGIPVGTYEAVLEPPLVNAGTGFDQQVGQRRSVTVRSGEQPTEVVFNVTAQGSLLIQVRDPQGTALPGACFSLTPEDQNRPPLSVCDDDQSDQNSATGRILITGIPAGRYTLAQTVAPPGFQAEAEQTMPIGAGTIREIVVTNRPEQGANLDVVSVDQQGNRLAGACFTLAGGTTTTRACDADGGEVGVTRFTGVESGDNVLRQVQAPTGPFATADDRAVRLEPGQTTTATVVNQFRPGRLQIRKTDEAGSLLAGSCFALRRENRTFYSVCDNDASDANRNDGTIALGTVVPGDYTLRETRSPAGHLPSADRAITIRPDQRTQVSVTNEQEPVPPRTGDLRIFKVDAGGRALTGSCFALLDGPDRVVASACDAADGADDGTVQIEDAPVGRLTLRETRRPSADFAPAPDVTITIVENQRVDVRVQNQLRTGRILIRKIDQIGTPLAGACFDVVEDDAGAACTNSDGELLFSGLAPGVYRVVETKAPPGHDVVAPRDAVTVRPGSTTTLTIVDRPVPPPPQSGSIQIRKFVCPAGADGPGIAFFNSSDPSGGGTARTAGCDPGDATFTLDGPTGQMRFRTGEQGRFQSTLLTGEYVLTELATGATADVSISVSTMTTVLVLNFVELAAGPATLNLIKYTCEPGFQGRIWLDFAEGCLAGENLTNDVVFLLRGPVSARRVTGDQGQGGATRFTALPAGDYRLREVVPEGITAVFAFCGQDPASPRQRFTGARANIRLAPGQTMTCAWFNVPEVRDATTGAVTIAKFTCPLAAPRPEFDWHANCDPQPEAIRFTLSRVWPSRVVWVIEQARARATAQPFDRPIEATTDSDGIANVVAVPPGVYRLQETGDGWCRAESDSVDARGSIVIRAGERTTVQIFNCDAIQELPNTGAGPRAADSQMPGETRSSPTVAPNTAI